MNNEKTKSVLAYIFGLIGGLIVLMMKGSEKRTKICAAQSITIALIYYIVRVAYGFIPFNIPFFDYIVSGLYLVASIIGIVKACNDNEEPEISAKRELAEETGCGRGSPGRSGAGRPHPGRADSDGAPAPRSL